MGLVLLTRSPLMSHVTGLSGAVEIAACVAVAELQGSGLELLTGAPLYISVCGLQIVSLIGASGVRG